MGSNLLYKASIVTTPTAYGVGVLNSIKPAQSFSEELVTNGNFSNGTTDWSVLNGTISIDNNRLKLDGISGATAEQTVTAIIGRTYLVTYEFTLGTATSGALIITGGNYPTLDAPQGVNSFYSIATSTSFRVRPRLGSSGTMFVDNVSAVEVTDADFDFTRTSSATRVNPDYLIETVSINSANLVQNGNFSELGAEAITNGDFATDSDWTLGADWSFGSNQVIGVNSITESSQQIFATSSSRVLKITYSVIVNSGQVAIYMSDQSKIWITTSGTYTDYVTSSSQVIEFDGRNSQPFNGSIDNVSVKQVDPNDEWAIQQPNGQVVEIVNNQLHVNYDATETQGSTGVNQTLLTSGKKYKITVDVAEVTGTFRIQAGGQVQDINSTGIITFTKTVTSSILYIIRASNAVSTEFKLNSISVIEIQENGVPRLDYTNGTASILLEPQSTNIVPYSSDFSQWNTGGTTTVTGGYLAPDGTNSAYKISGDTGFPSVSNIGNQTRTRTIYARTVSGTGQAHLCSYFGNTNNLFTITDQWQRFEVNGTTTSVGNTTFYSVDFRGSTNLTEVIVWGAQLEDLSYATSYIPTSGSTVTRAAETLNNAANSDLINSTEGVLYAELKVIDTDSTNKMITLSNGTNSTRVLIRYVGTTFLGQIRISGSNQYEFAYTPSNITDNLKIALKYKVNDFSLYVNGTKLNSSNSGNVFSSGTLTELAFDDGGGSSNFYGNVKSVAVFKEALSDTELACLTSTNNREIFLNYYYRMQYVGANTEALSCAEQTFNI